VETARGAGTKDLLLLKCTSAYPAPPSEMNLATMAALARTFGVPVGLSDHTMGSAVAVAAVALGACMVEKHFTISRQVKGPDSAFSMEPAEFAEMVRAIRVAEVALGTVKYGAGEAEEKSKVFRRSLYVVSDIKAGEAFTEKNVRAIRPGFGMHTRHLPEVLGRRATKDLTMGSPLDWTMVRPG
jgi:pseudaminic acid synthase